MRSGKKIFFLISLSFCSVYSIGQRTKIDSALKILPTLKDSARVNSLDQIARLHTIASIFINHDRNPDSALYYANLSLSEAMKLKYHRGVGLSYTRKAWIERMFFSNAKQAQIYGKEAISWFEKTANKDGLCDAFVEVGISFFSQSIYDEAINYFNTAYECFKGEQDPKMLWPFSMTGQVYREKGEYDKAFDVFRQSMQIAESNGNMARANAELFNIAHLYQTIEDYNKSISYYRQAWSKLKPDQRDAFDLVNYASNFSRLNQFDSAIYYYRLVDTSAPKNSVSTILRFYLLGIGEYYYLKNEYDSALPNIRRALYYDQQSNDRNQIKRALLDLARTLVAQKKYSEALAHTWQALYMGNQDASKQVVRDAYQILSTIYQETGNIDSSFTYYQMYIRKKDSVLSDQTKGKFAAFEFETKIQLMDGERKLQVQRLEQASQQKKFLILGLIALFLLGFMIVRSVLLKRKNEINRREKAENELLLQKLETEKAKAELLQQATELELQALRSQMNPHFIFNALNSINRFILQNNKSQAAAYLTKFSRLIRLILHNSQASLITLESELEALQLYLELESLRFEEHFEYKINIEKDLDISSIKVPPLIIQPYVENAIWHGLMHKSGKGMLEIELYQEGEETLCFKITDDGIGRQKAKELKSKSAANQKSLGMRITAERIAILQKKIRGKADIVITDLVSPGGQALGTEVLLKLPCLYD